MVAGLLDTDEPFWWTEVEQLVGSGERRRLPWLRSEDAGAAAETAPDEERLAVIAQLRRASPGPRPRMPQLRSDELPALEASGIAVGNHTLSHPCLPRCGEERLISEIDDAHHLAPRRARPRAKGLRLSEWGLDGRAERLLAALGYAVAFLFDHRVNPTTSSHPLRISGCGQLPHQPGPVRGHRQRPASGPAPRPGAGPEVEPSENRMRTSRGAHGWSSSEQRRLAAGCDNTSYFPDWVLGWWETLGGGRTAEVAIWRDHSGGLEAIVPLIRPSSGCTGASR